MFATSPFSPLAPFSPFAPVWQALPAFFSYFGAGLVILAVFLSLYTLLTPYRELTLIRQGNRSAALSLGGALLGMLLPLAVAIISSHDLYLMLGWGLVACTIQLLAFLSARLLLPQLIHDIPADRPATGIFLATLSVGVGILNAACIL